MSVHADLKLPREHGAWGMLYVPLLLGTLVGGGFSSSVLLLTLAATFLFVSREPALAWLRARQRGKDGRAGARALALYLGLAALPGAPLLLLRGYWGLAPLAVAGLLLLALNLRGALRREERTIAGEVLAIAGLTLTAPAAYYVASGGNWNGASFALWALSMAYFTSSVLYVKHRILTRTQHTEERDRARRHSALYHGALAAVLLSTVAARMGDWLLFLAFAPVLGRAFWHLAWPSRELRLQRIGWLEVGYSVVFLTLVTISFQRL
jgi:hypothetical protein